MRDKTVAKCQRGNFTCEVSKGWNGLNVTSLSTDAHVETSSFPVFVALCSVMFVLWVEGVVVSRSKGARLGRAMVMERNMNKNKRKVSSCNCEIAFSVLAFRVVPCALVVVVGGTIVTLYLFWRKSGFFFGGGEGRFTSAAVKTEYLHGRWTDET
eukprot:scaffold5519_cov166-Amphora_coffeaeformis.AAC.7